MHSTAGLVRHRANGGAIIEIREIDLMTSTVTHFEIYGEAPASFQLTFTARRCSVGRSNKWRPASVTGELTPTPERTEGIGLAWRPDLSCRFQT